MIDDDIATQKHLAQGGMARTALPWPASVGFAAKFMRAPSLRSAIRRHSAPAAELLRSDGLHAPPTEQRGYQTGARCIARKCSRVFFIAGLLPAPAFAFGERRRSEVVRLRVDQPSDKPRAAPEPQGAKSPTLPWLDPDRPHEDQSC